MLAVCRGPEIVEYDSTLTVHCLNKKKACWFHECYPRAMLAYVSTTGNRRWCGVSKHCLYSSQFVPSVLHGEATNFMLQFSCCLASSHEQQKLWAQQLICKKKNKVKEIVIVKIAGSQRVKGHDYWISFFFFFQVSKMWCDFFESQNIIVILEWIWHFVSLWGLWGEGIYSSFIFGRFFGGF